MHEGKLPKEIFEKCIGGVSKETLGGIPEEFRGKKDNI